MADGQTTTGRRRPADTKPWDLQPGDYCLRPGGLWVMTPAGHGPSRLDGWTITEHDDDTITAAPSIDAAPMPPAVPERWHGFLERGVWREV